MSPGAGVIGGRVSGGQGVIGGHVSEAGVTGGRVSRDGGDWRASLQGRG